MNLSFYSAYTGASQLQSKLDVISNNIANVNTYGYKTKNAGFVDLLYDNIREPSGELSIIRQGRGGRVEKTDTLFKQSALAATDNILDFALVTDGFFKVQTPGDHRIYYTRDGSFKLSENIDGNFYLVTSDGNYVLDNDNQRIQVNSIHDDIKVGVFDFNHREGFVNVGNNLFEPDVKNGEPFVKEDAMYERGYLEMSNVDFAMEMARLMQTQRNFQMTLRMVQTSDEIEAVFNSLRT